MDNLSMKKCVACEGDAISLARDQAEKLLEQLSDWELREGTKQLRKEFKFKNFLRTMSFVNALAYIANQENHHPDLEVSYNRCLVKYSTHAIGGLSENDFICAAKVDNLQK